MKLFFQISSDFPTIQSYLENQNLSRRLIRRLKKSGTFLLNKSEAKPYFKLKKGDILEISWQEDSDFYPAENAELDVLYEDDAFLVVAKPHNVTMHPTKKTQKDTLAQRVLGYYRQNNIEAGVHFINRLDYATSGIVLLAKNGYMHSVIAQDQSNIVKEYIAKVAGTLQQEEGWIKEPILRANPPSIIRFVDRGGKEAITQFRVIQKDEQSTFVQVRLFTGRTHQIRVHFSHIGHPLIGDGLYGSKEERMFLHCYFISFLHPITKKIIQLYNMPSWYKEEIRCQI